MQSGASDPTPSEPDVVISITLLTRNGMPDLAQLLASLGSQQACPRFEIVAVDSGSSDGSVEELARAGARVETIDPSQFSFGPTRQKAFGLTRGSVIVTLSQDAIPVGTDWLAKMTGPILDRRADIVQATEQISPEAQVRLNMHTLGAVYTDWPEPWPGLCCWGVAIGREAWERTGFGSVPMSEDKYLAVRARRLGLRFSPPVGAMVLHAHHYTLTSLAKRAFNEGMGAKLTEGRYPWWRLLRDLTRFSHFKYGLSSWLKYRTATLGDVLIMPVRPIFLWIGYAFGTGYWK